MYVEDIKDENTHTFLLITSLIINYQILCLLKHVEDVKGLNNL